MKGLPKSKLYTLIALTILLVVASSLFDRHKALGFSEELTNFLAGFMITLAIGLILTFIITAFNLIRARAKK